MRQLLLFVAESNHATHQYFTSHHGIALMTFLTRPELLESSVSSVGGQRRVAHFGSWSVILLRNMTFNPCSFVPVFYPCSLGMGEKLARSYIGALQNVSKSVPLRTRNGTLLETFCRARPRNEGRVSSWRNRPTVTAMVKPQRYNGRDRIEGHHVHENSASVYEQVIAVLPLSTVFAEKLGEDALKPASSSNAYRVVCPFHDDRNPSLELSDEKKVWHCFGCEAGGNLFTFEKLSRNLETVPDALASLAKRYPVVDEIVSKSRRRGSSRRGGTSSSPRFADDRDSSTSGVSLDLPIQARFKTPRLPAPRNWREGLEARRSILAVLAHAQEYFASALAEAEEGRIYLESRGFLRETIVDFGFGFAPDVDGKMSSCVSAMSSIGYDAETCVAAGIAKRDKKGRLYDTFRNRVMLPIRDEDGRVISFAGRLLVESDTAPKYLNGPGSHVFKKKEVVFGADLVKKTEESTAKLEYGMVVVVEGYMDVVAFHNRSNGRVACVAVMGTAVSKEQLLASRSLLGDVVDGKVVINLDGDSAGCIAAERLCDAVLCGMPEASCVYILQPPSHVKDVGEYFEVGGAEVDDKSYEAYIEENALPWIEWRVHRIMQDVLDSRKSVRSEAQVAQAAELGARNDGDDDDEGSWRDVTSDLTGVSQTAFLSEQMRRETLLLLDSMSGDSGEVEETGIGSGPGGLQNVSVDGRRQGGDKDALRAREQQKRRAESLARATKLTRPENATVEGAGVAAIAGCPVQVLEKIGAFAARALRASPGVNFPWLVHKWADILSDGETKRVPLLYDAIMSYTERHVGKRQASSPAYIIDLLPPAPWVVDELPKYKRNAMRASMGQDEDGKTQVPMSTYYGDKRTRSLSQERQQKQEKFLLPRIKQMQSPYTKGMISKPRASAEEIILRSLIWACDDDRLEGLEVLVGVMISMEEAGLVPFWTSLSRTMLFQYLVELDKEFTAEEIAADCEHRAWWDRDIELLFVPIEEFCDDELTSIRKIELQEPVATVLQAASTVEEMSKSVATGRAVDQLGDFMEAKLGADVEMNAGKVKELVDAVSGFAYLSAEERAKMDEEEEELDRMQQRDEQLQLLTEQLLRGEITTLADIGPNEDPHIDH